MKFYVITSLVSGNSQNPIVDTDVAATTLQAVRLANSFLRQGYKALYNRKIKRSKLLTCTELLFTFNNFDNCGVTKTIYNRNTTYKVMVEEKELHYGKEEK